MKVKIYHNGDDVFVAWKPDGFIPDCREFALMRRRNGIEEIVSTWVGFTDQEHKEGERRRRYCIASTWQTGQSHHVGAGVP